MVFVPAPPGASPHTRFVVLETANVAMSVSLLGIVGGIQFSAVFQSLLVGFGLHVALPAWSACVLAIRASTARILFISAWMFRAVGVKTLQHHGHLRCASRKPTT